jgi:hypothetical protein
MPAPAAHLDDQESLMHVPFKQSAAFLGVTAVIALAGCGSSSTTASTGSAAGGTSAAHTQSGGAPAGRLQSLAGELGVSVTKLESALQSVRQSTGSHPAGDRTAALAKALGISEAKVRNAMPSNVPPAGARPQGTPPAGAAGSGSASTTSSS